MRCVQSGRSLEDHASTVAGDNRMVRETSCGYEDGDGGWGMRWGGVARKARTPIFRPDVGGRTPMYVGVAVTDG